MPFTSIQQAKINAAQQRLDKAKATYQGWVTSYNDWTASIQGCYKQQIPNAAAASTWFNALETGPCTNDGKGCTNSSITNCKAVIQKTLNPVTIPNLKAAYNEQVAAQANYDKVVNEVAFESKNDPQNVIDQIKAEKEAEAEGKALKYKWIFGIVVVIIIGGAVFAYFKWIKKR